jgi:hypothetical protein
MRSRHDSITPTLDIGHLSSVKHTFFLFGAGGPFRAIPFLRDIAATGVDRTDGGHPIRVAGGPRTFLPGEKSP